MAQIKSIPAARRKLRFIFERLVSLTCGSDREILLRDLKKILDHDLTEEFHIMLDAELTDLAKTKPVDAEQIREKVYSMLSDIKFECRTADSTTILMSVGLFASSLFNEGIPANRTLTAKDAERLVKLLKKHYINPKAKIRVFHRLFAVNDGPSLYLDQARELCRRMRDWPSDFYDGEDLPSLDPQSDPVRMLEQDRLYGLILRHAVISVEVPKGELIMSAPYAAALGDPQAVQLTPSPALITARAWSEAAAPCFSANFPNMNLLVLEPMPLVRGVDYLELVCAPFRIFPFIVNAYTTMNCRPEDLVVSMALFESRDDAHEHYAEELRICAATRQDPEHPFSGEIVTISGPVHPGAIAADMTGLMKTLGITRIVEHEQPRYFEVEDEGGRVYVTEQGISTPLTAVEKVAQAPQKRYRLN